MNNRKPPPPAWLRRLALRYAGVPEVESPAPEPEWWLAEVWGDARQGEWSESLDSDSHLDASNQ